MAESKASKATIVSLSQIKAKIWRTPGLRWSTLAATACLGSMTGSAPPVRCNELRDPDASAWIGQNIDEVVEQLGRPTQSDGLLEGGKLIIYSGPQGPHYVFRTASGGQIVKVAKLDQAEID